MNIAMTNREREHSLSLISTLGPRMHLQDVRPQCKGNP